MAKTSTLESVISKRQAPSKVHRSSPSLPSDETLRFLLNYSRALQVFRNNITGQTYLILN